MPTFSIVIPTHDRPDHLRRLLTSIATQTFRDFDVYVVDDASPGEEAYRALTAAFAREMPVTYLRNDRNRGAQHSRNRGVAASTGRLIAFVDDDDEWLPRKLELQAAAASGGVEAVGLVYGWADTQERSGERVPQYRSSVTGVALGALLQECFIPSPTVVVHRDALKAVGGFDEAMPSCQDWDTWTRVVAAGFAVRPVQEVVAIYHKHDGPSIGTSPRRLAGYERYLRKHADLYRRVGLRRVLSEKWRGVAGMAAEAGDSVLTSAGFREAIRADPTNWRAVVRYGQWKLGVWP